MAYDRKDAPYRRAKAAGYRARSAFKLIELDDAHRLLRRGDTVIDLGAWPGGWIQVALERVGPTGHVVGVDLAAIDAFREGSVELITGDIRDPDTVAAALRALGKPADVLLCDLAPKLTGVRATDEARCAEVSEAAMGAAPKLLRPGGRCLMKVFMGEGYAPQLERLRRVFETVRATRPESTRRGSAELYVIGIGYRVAAPCG